MLKQLMFAMIIAIWQLVFFLQIFELDVSQSLINIRNVLEVVNNKAEKAKKNAINDDTDSENEKDQVQKLRTKNIIE